MTMITSEKGTQKDIYSPTRMATENSVSDDNRTAVGQVKSVRRVPVSRSTMVNFHVGWKSTYFFAIEIFSVPKWKKLTQPTRSQFWKFLVGCNLFFILVLKIGKNSWRKKTPCICMKTMHIMQICYSLHANSEIAMFPNPSSDGSEWVGDSASCLHL